MKVLFREINRFVPSGISEGDERALRIRVLVASSLVLSLLVAIGYGGRIATGGVPWITTFAVAPFLATLIVTPYLAKRGFDVGLLSISLALAFQLVIFAIAYSEGGLRSPILSLTFVAPVFLCLTAKGRWSWLFLFGSVLILCGFAALHGAKHSFPHPRSMRTAFDPRVVLVIAIGSGMLLALAKVLEGQSRSFARAATERAEKLHAALQETAEAEAAMREAKQKAEAANADLQCAKKALEATNTKLEELAMLDPLTGLLNRRAIESALAHETVRAQRSGEAMAAILIDCDDFKAVNDRYGYAGGDLVLKRVAEEMKRSLRSRDHAARIGGDEFLVLLPETRLAEAQFVAEKLCLALSRIRIASSESSSEDVRTTVSIGVSSVHTKGADLKKIVAKSQIGLRQSKSSGKNRVSSPKSWSSADSKRNTADILLDDHSFRPFSQAIYRLGDEQPVGYELLIRGKSGTLLETPDLIFAAAIEHDVLTTVDFNCLRCTVEASVDLDSDKFIHVNLFPSTLLESDMDDLLQTLQSSLNSSVCVELSEQQVIGDARLLQEPLRRLQKQGIRIAIDDVGFGKSSLETLILAEPDVIKIDKSCILGVSSGRPRRMALERLCRVAETLGAEVIAEGIETRDDLKVLIDLGINLGQGFLWGRPSQVGEQESPKNARLHVPSNEPQKPLESWRSKRD